MAPAPRSPTSTSRQTLDKAESTAPRIWCNRRQSFPCRRGHFAPQAGALRHTQAAGLLESEAFVGEIDIVLSPDGYIQRVSDLRFGGDDSAAQTEVVAEFFEWIQETRPDLDDANRRLNFSSDHVAAPMLMTLQEMHDGYMAAAGIDCGC